MYIYTLMRKIMVEGKWKWILREKCKKKKNKICAGQRKIQQSLFYLQNGSKIGMSYSLINETLFKEMAWNAV